MNTYSCYLYGDVPLIEISNLNNLSGKHILIVKDSFAEVVSPFLALGLGKLSIIDPRHFTGSLKSYVLENKPDAVVILSTPSASRYDEIDRDSHTSFFDLR